MKYIKKVIIENFQSHENTVLELDPSLNIIVGQSDKGKSAILRAIKWVLYNEPRGNEFIRYGTNECSVTLVMGDGYTITRTRKKAKNIYVVISPYGDKLEFENFGNEVPSEVIEATGVKTIKLDTDIDTKLNLNEQLDPPFLLAETGTIRAKAIGRIVNTNILDAAERDILKDISNNNVTVKNIEHQLEEIDQELVLYSDIETQEENIKKLEQLLEKIGYTNDKLEKLIAFKSRLSLIEESLEENKTINDKLKKLPLLVDNFNGLKEKYTLQDKLCKCTTKLSQIKESQVENEKILNSLKEFPKFSEFYNNIKEKYSLSDTLCKYFDKLNTLNTNISKDNTILQKLINIQKIEQSVQIILEKNSITEKFSDFNTKLKDIQSSISKGNDYMTALQKDLTNKVEQYSKMLKQLGKCPTCYNPISDSVISQIINEMEEKHHGCN